MRSPKENANLSDEPHLPFDSLGELLAVEKDVTCASTAERLVLTQDKGEGF
jgi:monomeric isocitrate dehydrogenase